MRLYYFIGGVILGMYLLTCANNIREIQGSSEQVDTLSWINEAGDIVASLKGDPKAFAVRDKKFEDSLARVYQTKEKNLIEYIVALEYTNSMLLAEVGTRETDYTYDSTGNCPPQIKNLRQTFSNPYYTARVQIGDSSFLHLQAYDTVTVLWKKVKEGNIFNRKNLIQLDVSTANPDTKVYGLKAFRVTEKNKKFGLGLHAGYGFSNSWKPAPYIGIGIHYSLIKF